MMMSMTTMNDERRTVSDGDSSSGGGNNDYKIRMLNDVVEYNSSNPSKSHKNALYMSAITLKLFVIWISRVMRIRQHVGNQQMATMKTHQKKKNQTKVESESEREREREWVATMAKMNKFKCFCICM